MALQDGIYLVRFNTPRGEGSGVAYLTDGKLYGGDSMMAYVGKFSEDGSSANAEVRVFQHSNTPGMESVLGTNSATLKLSGDVSGLQGIGADLRPLMSAMGRKWTLAPVELRAFSRLKGTNRLKLNGWRRNRARESAARDCGVKSADIESQGRVSGQGIGSKMPRKCAIKMANYRGDSMT
jgi:hypothetical protein